MLMWVMSDRAIPRSFAHDAGLRRAHLPPGQRRGRVGVRRSSTGSRCSARIRWCWDEAVKISGADPDFHRRDLWEAIESGDYPEWELGLQIFTEEQAEKFSFDILDADQDHARGTGAGARRWDAWSSIATRTTSSPRPSRWRSAPRTWCPASTSPTIRCWPAASTRTSTRRSRAWADRTSTRSRSTRRSRRCTTTSVTACTARPSIAGRVAYEPNSLGGGCPFQAGARRVSCRFRAAACDDRTRCAASRRSSPTTTRRRRCSSRARRRSSRRTSSPPSASS